MHTSMIVQRHKLSSHATYAALRAFIYTHAISNQNFLTCPYHPEHLAMHANTAFENNKLL